MGGDNQGQWLLQFYLYRAAFGMTIQEAIEAPKLSTEHFPGFFAPHEGFPNRVRIEPRFGASVIEELKRRGHDVDVAPDWTEGFVSAAQFDPDTGLHRSRVRPARQQERGVSGVRVRVVRLRVSPRRTRKGPTTPSRTDQQVPLPPAGEGRVRVARHPSSGRRGEHLSPPLSRKPT